MIALLDMQELITSSVFKFGASSMTRLLNACRIGKN
jgi:hypothetical protein